MGTKSWPGCSPIFGINLRRGSLCHCSFSLDSSAIGTSMDQNFHAESSTLKPCSPLSRRGKEEKQILRDEWERTQILAEMAYPGTKNIRISPAGRFCSGGFASTFPLLSTSLCTIQPWTCWGRRSSLLWLLCIRIHLSLLHLSIQLILSQEAPGDERRVMALVSCCSPH